MSNLPKSRGLAWRRRGDVLIAYWLCGAEAAKRGYPIKAHRIWSESCTKCSGTYA